MNTFRIDTHKKSGKVKLWMQTPHGYQLIMGWEKVDGVEEFANMLLDFCNHRKKINEAADKVKETSDKLLRQALGDDEYAE